MTKQALLEVGLGDKYWGFCHLLSIPNFCLEKLISNLIFEQMLSSKKSTPEPHIKRNIYS